MLGPCSSELQQGKIRPHNYSALIWTFYLFCLIRALTHTHPKQCFYGELGTGTTSSAASQRPHRSQAASTGAIIAFHQNQKPVLADCVWQSTPQPERLHTSAGQMDKLLFVWK